MADDRHKHTQAQDGAYEVAGEFSNSPLAARLAELSESVPDMLPPKFRETLGRASETAGMASEVLAPGLRGALASFGVTYGPSTGAVGEEAGHDGGRGASTLDDEARSRLADELARRIPERVREAREECGISRKQMPRLCGMDSKQYRNIEDGKVAKPSICDLLCISTVTGKSLDWLAGRDV